MNKYEVLKNVFGYSEFRKGQEEVIDALVNKNDCLAIMPTGAGKSICYQIPAMMGDGVTIVISPLISLMDDQVRQLKDSGVNCAFLNSSLSNEEFRNTLVSAYRGNYKLIYVAPERLVLDTFVKFSNSINVEVVIIDEAHCISQWGPDFRPSYLKIGEYLKKLDKKPVIGAFTATATKEVKEDIINILSLINPKVVFTGYDRKNLYFSAELIKDKDKDLKLINYLKNNIDKSGIIYASTRENVENVCKMLCNKGFKATRYHAGLSDEERKQNHHDFSCDNKTVMVATNAFGMGINKSNVSFVIHYNMPRDIEAYYQEAGRAGRDGSEADCILYYSGKDYNTQMYFINRLDSNENNDLETTELIKSMRISKLNIMFGYCKTTGCLRQYLLNYFNEQTNNTCGKCLNCESEFEVLDVTIEARKILNCVKRICEKRPLGEAMIVDTLRGSKNQKIDKFNLSKNPMYASLSMVSSDKVKNIMNHLYENEYLFKTTSEYPTVQVTSEGIELLNSDEQCLMKVIKKEVIIEEKMERNPLYNNDLFYRLKELRLQIAHKKGLPAFMVFNDATLKDMAEKSPKTASEFLSVIGVGKYKYEQYGKEFLELINDYYDNKKRFVSI